MVCPGVCSTSMSTFPSVRRSPSFAECMGKSGSVGSKHNGRTRFFSKGQMTRHKVSMKMGFQHILDGRTALVCQVDVQLHLPWDLQLRPLRTFNVIGAARHQCRSV